MMLPTHILIGLAIFSPILATLPHELQLPAVIGIIIGSTIPDIDLLIGLHRKTLHTPVYAWIGVLITGIGAVLSPTFFTITAVTILLGIAQHSTSDMIGGGLEHKPWEQTATKAVYSHYHKQWWKPRHYITYDGAPSDLAVFIILATATYPTYESFPYYTELLILLGIIGAIYTLSRKILPRIETYIYTNHPQLRPILTFFSNGERDR